MVIELPSPTPAAPAELADYERRERAAPAELAGYTGGSAAYVRDTLDGDAGWVGVRSVPVLEQSGANDCGDVAAAMTLRYWGHPGGPEDVRAASGQPASVGLSAGFLRDHLRAQGPRAYGPGRRRAASEPPRPARGLETHGKPHDRGLPLTGRTLRTGSRGAGS